MVSVVIHCNMSLPNQTESAEWLRQGFAKHGIDADVTGDKHKAADVHVVQGPHYAFSEWLGRPNVLWLNRCFYGDSRYDLSIGWLNPDGSRDFKNRGKADSNGRVPELKPKRETTLGCLILADYGKQHQARHWEVDAREKYFPIYFREHPADRHYRYFYSLDEMWKRCDVAIGGSGTALVDAAIEGLHVHSYDPLHVIQNMTDRQQWLIELSWAQWGHEAIMAGDFWEHLC